MQSDSDFNVLTDIELLLLLCSSNDDDALYKHFVERFLTDVQKECKRICENRKIDLHIGLQIAHETFERLRKYKSFKTDEIKLPNERKAILVYLYRFCTRMFNTYHKNERKGEFEYKCYFDDILSPQEKESKDIKVLKETKDLAIFIMGKLNPKERKIILTDLEYKRHHKYLPDDVIETLAEELNIKKDTVRKIRERAKEKIKLAIHEINQGG